jgi:predicted RNA-binding protein with PUA-like domain
MNYWLRSLVETIRWRVLKIRTVRNEFRVLPMSQLRAARRRQLSQSCAHTLNKE